MTNLDPFLEPHTRFYQTNHPSGLLLRHSLFRKTAFDAHTHETLSVGLIWRGRTHLKSRDKVCEVEQGEIVLIGPQQPHACNPVAGWSMDYAMLYVDPAWLVEMGWERAVENLKWMEMQTIRNAGLFHQLEQVCADIQRGRIGLEEETHLVESLEMLLTPWRDIEANGYVREEQRQTAVLNQVKIYLSGHMSENVRLGDLADISGLSPFYLLRSFRKEFGLPPHAFQIQLRIQHARRLLADGEPIAQVAANLGFADQSHLARCFRSAVGMTPFAYARQFGKKNMSMDHTG